MELINYSAESTSKLYSWLPHDLQAEKVIFFPDACPGKSPLPTGTVVFTRQDNWRKFAISDCGCGMLLGKSKIKREDFDTRIWDAIYFDLKANKGRLGDLGSGNHFLDALESYTDDNIYFLIHTGSRNESKLVDDLIDRPTQFDNTFATICDWAKENRYTILKMLQKYFGNIEILLDKNHNHFELTNDGVIIRKGAVKVTPNDVTVVPSHMSGDVVLVKATPNVADTLCSLCHGTGRVMSRSEAKDLSHTYNYNELRDKVYIPKMIDDASIKTDAPYCYRDLDACMSLISGLISIENRFSVFAYLGQM